MAIFAALHPLLPQCRYLFDLCVILWGRLRIWGIRRSISFFGRLFQFHKGTIKTCQSSRSTNDNLNFNSIKVRLKPIGAASASSHTPTFQFHKGTIKTPSLSWYAPSAHFNSIKVRLKQSDLIDKASLKADFNSIKVRLKHVYAKNTNGTV